MMNPTTPVALPPLGAALPCPSPPCVDSVDKAPFVKSVVIKLQIQEPPSKATGVTVDEASRHIGGRCAKPHTVHVLLAAEEGAEEAQHIATVSNGIPILSWRLPATLASLTPDAVVALVEARLLDALRRRRERRHAEGELQLVGGSCGGDDAPAATPPTAAELELESLADALFVESSASATSDGSSSAPTILSLSAAGYKLFAAFEGSMESVSDTVTHTETTTAALKGKGKGSKKKASKGAAAANPALALVKLMEQTAPKSNVLRRSVPSLLVATVDRCSSHVDVVETVMAVGDQPSSDVTHNAQQLHPRVVVEPATGCGGKELPSLQTLPSASNTMAAMGMGNSSVSACGVSLSLHNHMTTAQPMERDEDWQSLHGRTRSTIGVLSDSSHSTFRVQQRQEEEDDSDHCVYGRHSRELSCDGGNEHSGVVLAVVGAADPSSSLDASASSPPLIPPPCLPSSSSNSHSISAAAKENSNKCVGSLALQHASGGDVSGPIASASSTTIASILDPFIPSSLRQQQLPTTLGASRRFEWHACVTIVLNDVDIASERARRRAITGEVEDDEAAEANGNAQRGVFKRKYVQRWTTPCQCGQFHRIRRDCGGDSVGEGGGDYHNNGDTLLSNALYYSRRAQKRRQRLKRKMVSAMRRKMRREREAMRQMKDCAAVDDPYYCYGHGYGGGGGGGDYSQQQRLLNDITVDTTMTDTERDIALLVALHDAAAGTGMMVSAPTTHQPRQHITITTRSSASSSHAGGGGGSRRTPPRFRRAPQRGGGGDSNRNSSRRMSIASMSSSAAAPHRHQGSSGRNPNPIHGNTNRSSTRSSRRSSTTLPLYPSVFEGMMMAGGAANGSSSGTYLPHHLRQPITATTTVRVGGASIVGGVAGGFVGSSSALTRARTTLLFDGGSGWGCGNGAAAAMAEPLSSSFYHRRRSSASFFDTTTSSSSSSSSDSSSTCDSSTSSGSSGAEYMGGGGGDASSDDSCYFVFDKDDDDDDDESGWNHCFDIDRTFDKNRRHWQRNRRRSLRRNRKNSKRRYAEGDCDGDGNSSSLYAAIDGESVLHELIQAHGHGLFESDYSSGDDCPFNRGAGADGYYGAAQQHTDDGASCNAVANVFNPLESLNQNHSKSGSVDRQHQQQPTSSFARSAAPFPSSSTAMVKGAVASSPPTAVLSSSACSNGMSSTRASSAASCCYGSDDGGGNEGRGGGGMHHHHPTQSSGVLLCGASSSNRVHYTRDAAGNEQWPLAIDIDRLGHSPSYAAAPTPQY